MAIALEQAVFYIEGMEDVRSGQSKILQVIHMESISRADLIIAGEKPFDLIQFQRKQAIEVMEDRVLYYA